MSSSEYETTSSEYESSEGSEVYVVYKLYAPSGEWPDVYIKGVYKHEKDAEKKRRNLIKFYGEDQSYERYYIESCSLH